jgi:hypothetical protein
MRPRDRERRRGSETIGTRIGADVTANRRLMIALLRGAARAQRKNGGVAVLKGVKRYRI